MKEGRERERAGSRESMRGGLEGWREGRGCKGGCLNILPFFKNVMYYVVHFSPFTPFFTSTPNTVILYRDDYTVKVNTVKLSK